MREGRRDEGEKRGICRQQLKKRQLVLVKEKKVYERFTSVKTEYDYSR